MRTSPCEWRVVEGRQAQHFDFPTRVELARLIPQRVPASPQPPPDELGYRSWVRHPDREVETFLSVRGSIGDPTGLGGHPIPILTRAWDLSRTFCDDGCPKDFSPPVWGLLGERVGVRDENRYVRICGDCAENGFVISLLRRPHFPVQAGIARTQLECPRICEECRPRYAGGGCVGIVRGGPAICIALRRLPPSPLFLGIALTTTDTSCSSISFPAHGDLCGGESYRRFVCFSPQMWDCSVGQPRIRRRHEIVPLHCGDRCGNCFRTCGGAELVNRPSGRISARFDEKLDSAIGLSLRRRSVGLQ